MHLESTFLLHWPCCCSADEPPLALGQWLESKGLVSWAPRGGLKIGPSGVGGSGGGGGGSSGGVGAREGFVQATATPAAQAAL